ncbi:uncharacterized protein LOC117400729 [Acipenser ruthenus]|uniref:uncharacterized protein LOC117400729 n=1 Tax=Acipenser ruthenus TaxID=7906 RepID=UPI00145A927E|nr:uncharacterized protein LOC117400729 [Acipenser ruthenus]
MLEAEDKEEHYACVFIISDSSVWTKKISELKISSSSCIMIGSKVSFKLPIQLIDETGKQVILGEQEYEGALLFHSTDFGLCKEKENQYCKFINENKHKPATQILDSLVKQGNNVDRVKDVCGQLPRTWNTFNEETFSIPNKRQKIGGKKDDGLPDIPDTNHTLSTAPVAPVQLNTVWSPPSLNVKYEQAAENSFLSFTINDEDMSPQTPPEENADQRHDENPFAVLEKLIKENHELRKENAHLKQMLQAAQNAVPFPGLTQETRRSAACYLRMVLEHLEEAPSSSPPLLHEDDSRTLRRGATFESSQPSGSKRTPHSELKVFQERYMMPLIVDPNDPDRYADVLVESNKLHNVLKKAREQKTQQGGCLLNGIIDLVFSPQELAESHGLGLKGKDKEEKALDKIKVSACEAFLRQTCFEEGWREPGQVEFRKKFTAKICNARRDLKNSLQKSS